MSLKNDNLEQNVKFEFEESIIKSHTKCGEIFFKNENFFYFCISCEKEFENSKLFESHMIAIHLNEMKLIPIESIQEIYEFSEDMKFVDKYKEFKDKEYSQNCSLISNIKDNSSYKQDSANEENCFNIDDNFQEEASPKNYSIVKESFKPQCKLLGPGPFTCKICCKILKTQHTYRVHINLQHAGFGPFKCNICAHSMKTKLNLDNHIKRVHKNKEAQIYQCSYCELGFTSDSKLTLHIHKLHTFEKKFTCKICGKNFMSIGNLKTHEHIHSGIKPFQCEICGKKFIRSNNMDVHKRRHLSDRNIKCKLCNKMFYTRTSMHDHLISHTNEKNFSCDYCSTRFARKGDKLKHIQMKHPEFLSDEQKKYVCNICNADYALRVSFRQHMQSQHSVTLGNLNDSTIPKD